MARRKENKKRKYPVKVWRVLFRDKKGRFVSPKYKYEKKVKSVQVRRGGRYVTVIEKGQVTPEKLAHVTNRYEFEKLPPSYESAGIVKPAGKYKAWDAAKKVDALRGLRGKTVKVEFDIYDGKRKRTMSFHYHMKKGTKASYGIFTEINEQLSGSGLYLYDKLKGKILADRRGKQVTMGEVRVSEMI